jgi:hypothetical protein
MPDEFNAKNNDRWTKLMFGVLVFFGISTLILGVLRVGQSIRIPVQPYDDNLSGDLIAGFENSEPTADELANLDSDGDGLSDFDERYVYSTSPYLADSDSDGFSDKDEIDEGFDPNCPKGQDCRGGGGSDNDSGAGETPSSGDQYNFSELTEGDIAELRQMMLDTGQIEEEVLNSITDEQLIQVLNDIANNSQ